MKIRFSISRKLILSFGVLLIAVLSTSFLTYRNLDNNLQINRKIVKIHTPSESYLNDLYFLISNSNMLIKSWIFIDKNDDTPDKIKLSEIHSIDHPNLIDAINPLVEQWDLKDQEEFAHISTKIDKLFILHQVIMRDLSSYKSYSDYEILFDAEKKVEKEGEIIVLTNEIIDMLNDLRVRHSKKVVEVKNLFS